MKMHDRIKKITGPADLRISSKANLKVEGDKRSSSKPRQSGP